MAVAILVLQAFTGECGASGSAAQKESAATHVGRGPDQIADPLKSKHGIINKEGNRVDSMIGVCGAGGDERRNRSRFGDAFFENLSVLRFLVVEQRVHVDRFIELANTRIDAYLTE